MSDIITADNLPLVIGAVFTGLAGLAAWRTGGRLGDQAKTEKPPQPDFTLAGGLVMSNMGSSEMIVALKDIAAAVREATEAAQDFRSSKQTSLLEKIAEQITKLEDHERR